MLIHIAVVTVSLFWMGETSTRLESDEAL